MIATGGFYEKALCYIDRFDGFAACGMHAGTGKIRKKELKRNADLTQVALLLATRRRIEAEL